MATTPAFDDLRALFINCTLKRSPEPSNTQGLMDACIALMRANGVSVDSIRFVDHDVATGVYPDMREHGWPADAWPGEIWPLVEASDILVIGGPIWLGDNGSITRKLIERLYAMSGELNEQGQYLFYGKTGGAIITGNEDGLKHCAMSILYSLQHIGTRSRRAPTPAGSARSGPDRATSTPDRVAPRTSSPTATRRS